jgi:glycosyltransferase involved in cell wall biosynthesis
VSKLSIVIIGRNEEHAIGRCIEAALAAASQIGGAELIYVDSNSTDRTVSVAERFGAAVVQVDEGLRLCPSAGRYTGSRKASSDYILFLDADTLVYQDFLLSAFDLLDRDPRIGGVNGRIDDLNEAGDMVPDIDERYDDIADVRWLRGPCCLYRRRALLDAGSFDPELATEEEAELGLRLVRKGWKLKLIPVPMACHTRCYHTESWKSITSTFMRDIRSGRLGEVTRTIWHAVKVGNGWAFCRLRLNTTMQFAVLAWMVLAALLIPDPKTAAAASATIAIAGFIGVYMKKRSLKLAALFFPARFLNVVDILWGVPKVFERSPCVARQALSHPVREH